MRVASSIIAMIAVAASCGCATLRHGSTQRLAIVTEPSGARCDVTRAGELLGRVDATPGAIELQRGAQRVEYACTLAGHLDERDSLAVLDYDDLERYAKAIGDREAERKRREEWDRMSDVQKAGRVGLAAATFVAAVPVLMVAQPFAGTATGLSFLVDRGSGAAYGYSLPPVRMVPETFPDEAAREAFFAERRAQAEAMAAAARDVVDEVYCKPVALGFRCDPRRDEVASTLKRRLASLEHQRAATRIAPP